VGDSGKKVIQKNDAAEKSYGDANTRKEWIRSVYSWAWLHEHELGLSPGIRQGRNDPADSLPQAVEGVRTLRMKHLRKKTSMKEQLEEAIREIGGEPLQGSGFEDEKPEEGFSGGVPLPEALAEGPRSSIFSPCGSAQEIEDYAIDLEGVTKLELVIDPNHGRGQNRATLSALRLAKAGRPISFLTRSRVLRCGYPVSRFCVWQVFLAHLWQLTLAHLWKSAGQLSGMEMSWASG
jgi:hypothetical protein